MRLIDADALKNVFTKWLKEVRTENGNIKEEAEAIEACICQLDDAPTFSILPEAAEHSNLAVWAPIGMPPNNDNTVQITDFSIVDAARYIPKYGIWLGIDGQLISKQFTHWLPLPAPPQKG